MTGKAAKTEGVIRVNGEVVNDLGKWKKLVGFVPQEDIMIRQLTVRDNIAFSARYRLPASMSLSQKNDVVNQTLLSLGIDQFSTRLLGMSAKEEYLVDREKELILESSWLHCLACYSWVSSVCSPS